MSLINDILSNPLEPSYQAAHDRNPDRTATPSSKAAMITTLVLIGALFAISALTFTSSTSSRQVRGSLLEEIEKRKGTIDATTRQLERTREDVTRLRDQQLTGQGQLGTVQRLAQVEVLAAATTVRGPGVQITLDDSSTAANPPRGRVGSSDTHHVIQAQDIQTLVNQLWANQAEAISINGHRLTTLSTIRFAGDAILVAYRPLNKPYVISAIGPHSMSTSLDNERAAAFLDTLRKATGAKITVAAAKELTLPAGTGLSLRYAAPPKPATSASSTSPGETP